MRKYGLVTLVLLATAGAIYTSGSSSVPPAQARPLAAINIREMTIKSRLEIAPNYDSL